MIIQIDNKVFDTNDILYISPILKTEHIRDNTISIRFEIHLKSCNSKDNQINIEHFSVPMQDAKQIEKALKDLKKQVVKWWSKGKLKKLR